MAPSSPTPDPSWKGPPLWLVYLLILCGPPAALVAWLRTTIQNPFLLAALVLAYWVIVFVARFLSKIWGELEDPSVKQIAGWIKAFAQEKTSRYYGRYCQHLIYEHQVFDVKGLSTRTAHDLELEQIFVDLKMSALALHQVKGNPVPVVPQALQGARSLWEYLSTPTLANRHLVILGAPGTGKTTLLKHLALTLAQPRKYRHQRRLHHHFPILLILRDHAPAIAATPTYSLAQAVADHMQRKWQQSVPVSWITHQLEQGICLILLDGLDEVADIALRRQVVAWVQNQMHAYGQNRFVLTSRPYGYRDNPLDGVTTLDVAPFTPQQIEQFIRNWYLANVLKSWGKDDPGMRKRAEEGSLNLLHRLRSSSSLSALAVNPLLLTMIATVHHYRSSLPDKRVELYSEICEVFLGKRAEARGITQDLSPAQKRYVLQVLACSMMKQGKREMAAAEAEHTIRDALLLVSSQFSPGEFLRLVENTSGLLLERNPGFYGFAHLTFQEYLAAVALKESQLENLLVAQVGNPWWHETIRLYCAQADATAIVLACLANTPPAVEALTLAIECHEEKQQIQPQAQEKLMRILQTGVEDANPRLRGVVAEALLRRRVQQMIHLHDEIYIDTSLVTCAEYQLFLNEQRVQGRYYQPDHWKGNSFPPGTGNMPILGVRQAHAKAFCAWLTQRETEQWLYRLPHETERSMVWQQIGPPLGYWTQGGFAWIREDPIRLFEFAVSCASSILDRTGVSNAALFGKSARSLALTLDFDFALALTFDIANSLKRATDYSRKRGITLNTDLDHALALDYASNCAFTLYRTLTSDLAFNSALDHALTLVIALNRARNHGSSLTHEYDSAADICVMLALLQSRREGNYLAYEGILLVKERHSIT